MVFLLFRMRNSLLASLLTRLNTEQTVFEVLAKMLNKCIKLMISHPTKIYVYSHLGIFLSISRTKFTQIFYLLQ